jgi:hypothetical protein
LWFYLHLPKIRACDIVLIDGLQENVEDNGASDLMQKTYPQDILGSGITDLPEELQVKEMPSAMDAVPVETASETGLEIGGLQVLAEEGGTSVGDEKGAPMDTSNHLWLILLHLQICQRLPMPLHLMWRKLTLP